MNILIHNTGAEGLEEIFQARGQRNQAFRQMIKNGTLSKLDFEDIDPTIKKLQRHELVGMQDLIDMGLSRSTPISKTIVTLESNSGMGAAQININPSRFDDNESLITQDSVPNPIIHHTFSVAFRQEGFSYKRDIGESESMYQVLKLSESLVMNGSTAIAIQINSAVVPIYGYTTHPNRATETLTAAWTTATAAQIIGDVEDMMDEMFNTNNINAQLGTIMMYVPVAWWMSLSQDFSTSYAAPSLYRKILEKFPQIKDIKPSPGLAAPNVIMSHMRRKNIELSVSQQPTAIPHLKTVELERTKVTTYASWVPLIRPDYSNKTGIVHGSTA